MDKLVPYESINLFPTSLDSNRLVGNKFIVQTNDILSSQDLGGPSVVTLGFALPHTSEGVSNVRDCGP